MLKFKFTKYSLIMSKSWYINALMRRVWQPENTTHHAKWKHNDMRSQHISKTWFIILEWREATWECLKVQSFRPGFASSGCKRHRFGVQDSFHRTSRSSRFKMDLSLHVLIDHPSEEMHAEWPLARHYEHTMICRIYVGFGIKADCANSIKKCVLVNFFFVCW